MTAVPGVTETAAHFEPGHGDHLGQRRASVSAQVQAHEGPGAARDQDVAGGAIDRGGRLHGALREPPVPGPRAVRAGVLVLVPVIRDQVDEDAILDRAAARDVRRGLVTRLALVQLVDIQRHAARPVGEVVGADPHAVAVGRGLHRQRGEVIGALVTSIGGRVGGVDIPGIVEGVTGRPRRRSPGRCARGSPRRRGPARTDGSRCCGPRSATRR